MAHPDQSRKTDGATVDRALGAMRSSYFAEIWAFARLRQATEYKKRLSVCISLGVL